MLRNLTTEILFLSSSKKAPVDTHGYLYFICEAEKGWPKYPKKLHGRVEIWSWVFLFLVHHTKA